MDSQDLAKLAVSAAEKKPSQFNETFHKIVAEKMLAKFQQKKQELAQSFFQQPINEDCEGKNIIDGLKRIVDLQKPQTIMLDNYEEITVDPASAMQLVKFFNLHDSKEQFALQRKLRRSAHEFLSVAASAAADMSLALKQ